MSRNLILASISQLTFDDLRIFLESVKRSGCEADLVFFAGESSTATLDQLNQAGVRTPRMDERLIKVPLLKRKLNLYKWAFPLMKLYRWAFVRLGTMTGRSDDEMKSRFAKRYYKINSMRFFYYRDFLRSHFADYDKVLISDVRDVIFQRDPFAMDWEPHTLYCFLEYRGHTIRSNRWNRYWIERIGGKALLEKIGDNPISCAGVTYGDAATMLAYFDRMCAHLVGALDKYDLDQGMHNVIVWEQELPHVIRGECDDSAVATIGLMPDDAIRFNDSDQIIDVNGNVIPIIHQYDRKRFAEERMVRRLGLSAVNGK